MDIIFCKLIASFNEIYIYPISGQTTNQSRGLTSGHCRPKISDLDWHLSNNKTLKRPSNLGHMFSRNCCGR